MLIREAEFAAIDFEATGPEAGGADFPIQIGLARMKNGKLVKESFFRSYLEITDEKTSSMTLNPEHFVGAPSLLSLWPVISGHLRNRCVVAHGAGCERRHLRAFPFHGFGPWIDTLQLARVLWPGLAEYSLGALLTAFGIEGEANQLCVGLKWHDALYDAVACLLVLRKLIEGMELQPVSILENPGRWLCSP